MTTTAAQPKAAEWSLIYWPVALAAAILAFYIPHFARPSLEGAGLILGAVLILGPELYCIIRKQFQSTFSEWVWRTVRITGTRPVNQWNAEQFLLLCAYCSIAIGVDQYLWHLGAVRFSVGIGMTIWLAFHLFFHWWA